MLKREWAVMLAIFGAGMGVAAPSHAAESPTDGAYVSLFGWNWDSIAQECTRFLGPKGFTAVQVSPPNEHRSGADWGAQYMPVSYRIASRAGDREQFGKMVAACKAAGVQVYVEAVVKTMAKGIGKGSAGCYFDSGVLSYPCAGFARRDFVDPCLAADGSRIEGVQCWSGTFEPWARPPELNTSSERVRDAIAAYLKDLRSLGVAGFRIRGAGSIPVADLNAILERVPQPFFLSQEIVRQNGLPDPRPYRGLGAVNEFVYAHAMRQAFLGLNGFNLSRLPEVFGSWGLTPSAAASPFVANHDTERTACSRWSEGGVCANLTPYNGDRYYLAHVFMLAYDYGYPQVSSGYHFSDPNAGPPAQPYVAGTATPSNCSETVRPGAWTCVHRDPRVANMVGFRKHVAGAPVAGWQTQGENRIAFQRQGKGFVAVNNTSTAWQTTLATGLPDGSYCNIVAVGDPASCPPSAQIRVSGGQATVSVEPFGAVALKTGGRTGSEECTGGSPQPFTIPDLPNAGINRFAVSAPVTIQGLKCAVRVSIKGGSYSIDGRPFTSAEGTISNGQTLRVQVQMPTVLPGSAYPNFPVIATVTVGSVNQTFSAYPSEPVHPCLTQPVCTSPARPVAGQPVTVYYRGALAGSASLKLHWGVDAWKQVKDAPMVKDSDGYWQVTLTLPACAAEFDYVFTNGSAWDNNQQRDWKIKTAGGTSCAGA